MVSPEGSISATLDRSWGMSSATRAITTRVMAVTFGAAFTSTAMSRARSRCAADVLLSSVTSERPASSPDHTALA